MMWKRSSLVVFVTSLALAAACSSAAKPAPPAQQQGPAAWPSSVAAIAAYQGADRQVMLETGAKAEASITWYTGLVGGIQDGVVSQFQQKYPYLKVNVYRADAAAIASRVTEEAKAHKAGFDVVNTGGLDLGRTLREANAFTPYFSPTTAQLPAGEVEQAPNGLVWWQVPETECFSFAYNTNLLPASAVPKTLQDLLSPALKGKMAVAGSSTGINFMGDLLTNQGDAFAQQFAKQNIQVQQISGKALSDLISSGEVVASPTIFQPHAKQEAAAGAPIQWVPLEPVTCAGGGGPAVSPLAPHPHAAMLFVDFLFGPEAVKIYQDLGYLPSVTEKSSRGFKTWDPQSFATAAEFQQHYTQWQDAFNKLLLQK
ncbi:MAG TPA: extracellular solute-binding protein [Dehalococcoidia bacterium]|nr:extracellular solute-binding protein [Dehalococcoidia bacterium]